jgi:hypothetical protein
VDDDTTVEECEVEEEYHPPPVEEVIKEHIHEESCQEDEDLYDKLVSILSLD